MTPRPGPLIWFICLLAVCPLLTGQQCGLPAPSHDPIPGPGPEPEPIIDEIIRITAVYGHNLIELADGAIWEVVRSSGAGFTIGTDILTSETSIEEADTGLQHPARRLGVRVRSSSIYQILNFGEVVELMDGSSWRVDGPDQSVVFGWLPFEVIILVQKPTIGYLLVRVASGQYIRVNLN